MCLESNVRMKLQFHVLLFFLKIIKRFVWATGILTLMWWTLQGKQCKKKWQSCDWMVKITAIYWVLTTWQGFPGVSVVKNLPANAGNMGLTPGPGRSPGEGNGSPLQYSCLGNPTDKGAWQANVQYYMADTLLGGFLLWFVFWFWPHPVICGILVPRPRMEPVPPALGMWSLNYEEIPLLGVLRLIISVSLWVTT